MKIIRRRAVSVTGFQAIFFPKMIIWVFRLKTRDERGGGLPKGRGVGCLGGFVIRDRVLQGRGPGRRFGAMKKYCEK